MNSFPHFLPVSCWGWGMIEQLHSTKQSAKANRCSSSLKTYLPIFTLPLNLDYIPVAFPVPVFLKGKHCDQILDPLPRTSPNSAELNFSLLTLQPVSSFFSVCHLNKTAIWWYPPVSFLCFPELRNDPEMSTQGSIKKRMGSSPGTALSDTAHGILGLSLITNIRN